MISHFFAPIKHNLNFFEAGFDGFWGSKGNAFRDRQLNSGVTIQ
jgi:hypothetical protein